MKHFLMLTIVLALLSAKVCTQSLSTNISAAPPPLLSTSISTALITVVVPVPTSPAKIYVTSPSCPSSNGSYYINKFGAEFLVECPFASSKAKRVDILSAYISRFADCVDVCDPGTECLGLLFNPTSLGCAGYKCQPAPLNSQWAADMTAKGGMSIAATSCGGDQDGQILFNVENAYLNQAAGSISTNTPTVEATGGNSPTSPTTSSEPSSAISTAASATPSTSSTPIISQISASTSSTYTPAVVQTNVASQLAIPKFFAGIIAVFPLFGF